MIQNPETEENLKKQFLLFASGKNSIKFSQVYKWFKQSGIFDESITSQELELNFNKISTKKADYETFSQVLNSLFSKECLKSSYNDYVEKLISCGSPEPIKMIHVVKIKRKTQQE